MREVQNWLWYRKERCKVPGERDEGEGWGRKLLPQPWHDLVNHSAEIYHWEGTWQGQGKDTHSQGCPCSPQHQGKCFKKRLLKLDCAYKLPGWWDKIYKKLKVVQAVKAIILVICSLCLLICTDYLFLLQDVLLPNTLSMLINSFHCGITWHSISNLKNWIGVDTWKSNVCWKETPISETYFSQILLGLN